jgi:hypothetical protein
VYINCGQHAGISRELIIADVCPRQDVERNRAILDAVTQHNELNEKENYVKTLTLEY